MKRVVGTIGVTEFNPGWVRRYFPDGLRTRADAGKRVYEVASDVFRVETDDEYAKRRPYAEFLRDIISDMEIAARQAEDTSISTPSARTVDGTTGSAEFYRGWASCLRFWADKLRSES